MKRIFFSVLACLFFVGVKAQVEKRLSATAKSVSISPEQLQDKIKGGWAGQTIGVTFGGPYEFKFNGTIIGDYQPLKWYDGYLKETMLGNPYLYDDLYMDLTFVDVFEKYGLDAPVDSFANAFGMRVIVCGMPMKPRVTTYSMVLKHPCPGHGNTIHMLTV